MFALTGTVAEKSLLLETGQRGGRAYSSYQIKCGNVSNSCSILEWRPPTAGVSMTSPEATKRLPRDVARRISLQERNLLLSSVGVLQRMCSMQSYMALERVEETLTEKSSRISGG